MSKSFYTHHHCHLYRQDSGLQLSQFTQHELVLIHCSFVTYTRSPLCLQTLKPVMCESLWFEHTQQISDSRPLTIHAGGLLTVEVRADGVPCQETVDGNLIDDVEQQEGQTGEAEGLQQTPCVAWRRRTASVSSPPPLSLRISTCYYWNPCTEPQKEPLWSFFFK